MCLCVRAPASHLSHTCLLRSWAGKGRGRNQSCRCKCLHLHKARTGSRQRLRWREKAVRTDGLQISLGFKLIGHIQLKWCCSEQKKNKTVWASAATHALTQDELVISPALNTEMCPCCWVHYHNSDTVWGEYRQSNLLLHSLFILILSQRKAL